MAEIRVEHKQGRSAWPWIVGIIVLALLAWAMFGRKHQPQTSSAIRATPSTTAMMHAEQLPYRAA
jgi:hypothetical protein